MNIALMSHDRKKELIKQLSRATYEWRAGLVLVISRRLADKEHLGVRASRSENTVGSGLM